MQTLQWQKEMVQTHVWVKQWEKAKVQGLAHRLKVDM
jgi:hypothetical protein